MYLANDIFTMVPKLPVGIVFGEPIKPNQEKLVEEERDRI